MNVRVFQHVPFEGLGAIEAWLEERDATVEWHRWLENPAAPDMAGVDLLIVLGGPMSVNDPLPWLDLERAAIRQAIDRGSAVLGICLGAQQITRVLGGTVAPGPDREIGWWPIHVVPSDSRFAGFFPEEVTVFHWHGEACSLPPGAYLIAESPLCPVQAFSFGARVLALQFHLETTPDSARALAEHCPDDLRPGPCVQPLRAMLGHDPRPAHRLLRLLLDRLVSP